MKKSSKESKFQLSRRQMMGAMGCASVSTFIKNPIDILLNGLVEGVISTAKAAETKTAPRKYIFYYLGGGAPRWTFDLALNPYSADSNAMPNPMVNTRFADTGGADAGLPQYKTISITRNGATVNMPYLWACDIPTSDGNAVPMANLLDNWLVLRGLNNGADGHGNNADKQQRPNPGAPSFGGLVADRSPTLIPAVGLSGGRNAVYKSAKGVGQTSVNLGNNVLNTIFAPFSRTGDNLSSVYMNRRTAMDTAVNKALKALGDYAKSSRPGSQALYGMRSNAEELLKKGIGNLAGEYTTLRDKYAALIARCALMPIPGVTDKNIPLSIFPMITNAAGTPQGIKETIFPSNTNSFFLQNQDLRTLLVNPTNQQTAFVSNMAEGFAVIEYLILNGYSSAVQMGTGGVNRLYFESAAQFGNMANTMATNANANWGSDEHTSGSAMTLIINSFMYRSLCACLYELISQSKKQPGFFEDMVIQIGSEFSRSARVAAGAAIPGSDHGWQANVVSLISGAIKSPLILGNVRSTPNNGGYAGNWGYAANVKVEGADRLIGWGHMSSTLAHLLRVARPFPNNIPLVLENSSGGGISPVIELGRITG